MSISSAVDTVSDPSSPQSFFRSGNGLFVWHDFRKHVLEAATPASVPSIKQVELSHSMRDGEVRLMLGEGGLFTESEVCALIADLIEDQRRGNRATLLESGYPNLFYLRSSVALVSWVPACKSWEIHAWPQAEYVWHAGRRLFCRTNG